MFAQLNNKLITIRNPSFLSGSATAKANPNFPEYCSRAVLFTASTVHHGTVHSRALFITQLLERLFSLVGFLFGSPFNLISISKLNCSITFCSDSFFIQDRSMAEVSLWNFQ
jgi:hypothetical protein